MNSVVFQLMTMVASQHAPADAYGDIPFWGKIIALGPYGVIIVLCLVVKHLYTKREEDQKQFAKEKQDLNNEILSVAKSTTAAVVQNTEVQKQLLEYIESD